MARPKSVPGSKGSRTKSKEQSVTGNSVNPSEMGAAAETGPQDSKPDAQLAISVPDSRPVPLAKVANDAATAPEPRKMEVVKNDSRKNVVPINLEDEIRRRAYELYQQRGGSAAGSEAEDWLTAEREVKQRYRPQSA